MSTPLIGADGFLLLRGSLPEEITKKIITPDYRGFAGVQPPATHPPPASIRSSELSYPAQYSSPGSDRFIVGCPPTGVIPLCYLPIIHIFGGAQAFIPPVAEDAVEVGV